MMYGLTLGYDVNPEFHPRLEYNSFGSATSDDFWDYSALPWVRYYDSDFKLTVTPVILSGIYRFSPFYTGAGMGSSFTEFKDAYVYEDYFEGILMNRAPQNYTCSDNPIRFLVLAGFEHSGEGFSGGLEVRCIVAETDLPDWLQGGEIDLGGFQVCAQIWIPL